MSLNETKLSIRSKSLETQQQRRIILQLTFMVFKSMTITNFNLKTKRKVVLRQMENEKINSIFLSKRRRKFRFRNENFQQKERKRKVLSTRIKRMLRPNLYQLFKNQISLQWLLTFWLKRVKSEVLRLIKL